MCFGKAKVDNSIQQQQLEESRQARLREEERAARITAGNAQLDSTFSTFDDAFYNARQQDYLDYYQPQLDKQFKDAKDALTFAFARNGTLASSAAGQKQADLQTQYDNERASLLSKAGASVDDFKANVANEKASLVSQLQATGDADRVSNEALGRTQNLRASVPAYDSLGDIFSGVASAIGNYSAGKQAANVYNAYYGGSSNPRAATTTTVR